MNIQETKRLFEQYRQELSGISRDLKQSVQDQQIAEIRKKYEKPIAQATVELQNEAARLESEITKLSDPTNALIRSSHSQCSKEVSPGDQTLVNIIGNLPKEALAALVELSINPIVRLAALGRANGLDDHDLKLDILKGVQLPLADIKAARHQAISVYETVLAGGELKQGGLKPSDRLTLGYQIEAHRSKI